MRPEYAEFLRDAEKTPEYWTQTAILDFTEELSRLMSEANPPINRAELAKRIKASPAYVTKVLRGNVNFTLETMTKLARAVGAVVRIHLAPDGVIVTWTHQRAALDQSIDDMELDDFPTWQVRGVRTDPVADNIAAVQ
jgi:hypothetical protein